jgi:hypothetical protein
MPPASDARFPKDTGWGSRFAQTRRSADPLPTCFVQWTDRLTRRLQSIRAGPVSAIALWALLILPSGAEEGPSAAWGGNVDASFQSVPAAGSETEPSPVPAAAEPASAAFRAPLPPVAGPSGDNAAGSRVSSEVEDLTLRLLERCKSLNEQCERERDEARAALESVRRAQSQPAAGSGAQDTGHAETAPPTTGPQGSPGAQCAERAQSKSENHALAARVQAQSSALERLIRAILQPSRCDELQIETGAEGRLRVSGISPTRQSFAEMRERFRVVEQSIDAEFAVEVQPGGSCRQDLGSGWSVMLDGAGRPAPATYDNVAGSSDRLPSLADCPDVGTFASGVALLAPSFKARLNPKVWCTNDGTVGVCRRDGYDTERWTFIANHTNRSAFALLRTGAGGGSAPQ